MTRPGIEPRSPGPLVNYWSLYQNIKDSVIYHVFFLFVLLKVLINFFIEVKCYYLVFRNNFRSSFEKLSLISITSIKYIDTTRFCFRV